MQDTVLFNIFVKCEMFILGKESGSFEGSSENGKYKLESIDDDNLKSELKENKNDLEKRYERVDNGNNIDNVNVKILFAEKTNNAIRDFIFSLILLTYTIQKCFNEIKEKQKILISKPLNICRVDLDENTNIRIRAIIEKQRRKKLMKQIAGRTRKLSLVDKGDKRFGNYNIKIMNVKVSQDDDANDSKVLQQAISFVNENEKCSLDRGMFCEKVTDDGNESVKLIKNERATRIQVIFYILLLLQSAFQC